MPMEFYTVRIAILNLRIFTLHFRFFFFFFFFFETGLLCIALAVLELTNLPASASQVLGLKECAIKPGAF
jgi:hypothetical protein